MDETKKISLEDMKAISLEILKEIHEICIKEGFRYTLLYGTLLGAIRHSGFIPWDDDIDIGMPRKDYERFLEYCSKNQTSFKLICNSAEPNYGYLFAKAIDPNTVIIEKIGNRKNVEKGVFVDIFPIDGVGDSYEDAVKNLNKSRFRRELLVAANWAKFVRSKTRPIYYEPIRLAFYCMSRFSSYRNLITKIEAIYASNELEAKEYASCICGAYRNKEIMKSEVFFEYKECLFEGYSFKIISKYDEYLKTIYGDYMKLPPEEKRVTHHDFEAFYK